MAEILQHPDPWTFKTVPEALMAMQAASGNAIAGSTAAIVRSADWIIVRTPSGMGRFRPEVWNRRVAELMAGR